MDPLLPAVGDLQAQVSMQKLQIANLQAAVKYVAGKSGVGGLEQAPWDVGDVWFPEDAVGGECGTAIGRNGKKDESCIDSHKAERDAIAAEKVCLQASCREMGLSLNSIQLAWLRVKLERGFHEGWGKGFGKGWGKGFGEGWGNPRLGQRLSAAGATNGLWPEGCLSPLWHSGPGPYSDGSPALARPRPQTDGKGPAKREGADDGKGNSEDAGMPSCNYGKAVGKAVGPHVIVFKKLWHGPSDPEMASMTTNLYLSLMKNVP